MCASLGYNEFEQTDETFKNHDAICTQGIYLYSTYLIASTYRV